MRELLTLHLKEKERKERKETKQRAACWDRTRARKSWNLLCLSPVQQPRVTGTPYRRKHAGPLVSAPGQAYSFTYFAHAHAHTRTHAHMRAHTDPSPRRASHQGFWAELAAGPSGLPRAC